MSDKKAHSAMGLPRVSGKRRWSGDGDDGQSPSKAVCTSPPYALCAEDVLPPHPLLPPAPLHSSQPLLSPTPTTAMKYDDGECPLTTHLAQDGEETVVSDCDDVDALSDRHDEDDDNFIDDEEDKDSGFVDGNSIDDNSSDDDSDVKGDTSFTSTASSSSSPLRGASRGEGKSSPASLPPQVSDLQMSLAKVLPTASTSCDLPPTTPISTLPAATSAGSLLSTSSGSSLLPTLSSSSSLLSSTSSSSLLSSTSSSFSTPLSSVSSSFSTLSSTSFASSIQPPPLSVSSSFATSLSSSSPFPSTSLSSSLPPRPVDAKNDSNLTTVTAAQTGTTVTSAYQGPTPTPSYDPHAYQASGTTTTYTPDAYQNRPCTPSWSCTFYDGSQPTATNKYMEISPNRASLSTQSIQCDENGKSYLELGSAAPYASSYAGSDCGSFTTSPSTYNGSSYSQTFSPGGLQPPPSPPAPYPPPGNGYFNNRPNYSPGSPYGYHGGDPLYTNGYDGEAGCSYGYVNGNYLPHNPGRGGSHTVPNRIQPQRCSSPVCDPTRASPRPTCYQQHRLSTLNVSMFKLNRFSRFPEPSLHRYVLIYNTLRHIEREMEAEGVSMAAILAHSHAYGTPHGQGIGSTPPPGGAPSPPPPHAPLTTGAHCPPDTMPSTPPHGEGPLPSLHSHLIGTPVQPHPPPTPPSTSLYSSEAPPPPTFSPIPYSPQDSHSRDSPMPFDHPRDSLSLRPFSPPLPASGGDRQPLGDPPESLVADEDSVPSHRLCEDRTEGINWCSVLSLSSQTDLDSMNNNECHEWNNEEGEHNSSPALPLSSPLSTLTPLSSRGTPHTSHTTQGTSSNINSTYSSSAVCSSTCPSAFSTATLNEERDNQPTPNWKLPPLSAEDVLRSFPEPPRRQEEELDSIIKVLVGS